LQTTQAGITASAIVSFIGIHFKPFKPNSMVGLQSAHPHRQSALLSVAGTSLAVIRNSPLVFQSSNHYSPVSSVTSKFCPHSCRKVRRASRLWHMHIGITVKESSLVALRFFCQMVKGFLDVLPPTLKDLGRRVTSPRVRVCYDLRNLFNSSSNVREVAGSPIVFNSYL